MASANRNVPAEAIVADTEGDLEQWLKLNADFAKTWPNITIKREPPADAKEFDGVPDKLSRFFSPELGGATEFAENRRRSVSHWRRQRTER